MDKDIEKLKFLLESWAQHSEEHRGKITEWIVKAKSMGEDGAAGDLASAVDALNESIKYLKKAQREIENE